jgi:hypothetical protein
VELENGESRAGESLPNRPLRSSVCGAILTNIKMTLALPIELFMELKPKKWLH